MDGDEEDGNVTCDDDCEDDDGDDEDDDNDNGFSGGGVGAGECVFECESRSSLLSEESTEIDGGDRTETGCDEAGCEHVVQQPEEHMEKLEQTDETEDAVLPLN